MVRIKRMRRSTAGDMPAISLEDRSVYEEWLRSVGFFELDEQWAVIKQNWKDFLSTTSPPTRRSMPTADRHQRVAIQEALWERMDGLEVRSKSWPEAAQPAPNQQPQVQEATAFESPSARRSFQAIWTGMVCFLVYSKKRGKLEEMGLMLKKEQEQRLEKLVTLLMVERVIRDSLHNAVQNLLRRAVMDGSSSTKDNMVLWWMAILVRSALAREGEDDYISRGQCTGNILLIHIGLPQRLEALAHYSKVLVYDQVLWKWKGEERCAGEIRSELKRADDKWTNQRYGMCLDDKGDKRKLSANVYLKILGHQGVEDKRGLEGTKGTVIYEVGRLLRVLREKRETRGKKRPREEVN